MNINEDSNLFDVLEELETEVARTEAIVRNSLTQMLKSWVNEEDFLRECEIVLTTEKEGIWDAGEEVWWRLQARDGELIDMFGWPIIEVERF